MRRDVALWLVITTLLAVQCALLTGCDAARATPEAGEDGHALWLRMKANSKPAKVVLTAPADVKGPEEPSPTVAIALSELRQYWHGEPVELEQSDSSDVDDGFTLTRKANGNLLLQAHGRDVGLLYGVYHLLRQQETGRPVEPVEQKPAWELRLLNHWDNLDGSIERGYAGNSIFWGADNLPDNHIIKEYARANASIGINGTVLNNVNASPQMLATEYLHTVKHIADILRPFGIRVFLSVNFASPMKLGVEGVNDGDTLSTADPASEQVAEWWRVKVNEIYELVPDFGGFLVKANSEGQPGPGDFGRSHAQGANMLADALAPHGGIVMWRAFVYGYHAGTEDRVMKAVSEFKPLDGQFRENVILQIKNGPLDFQPREPYSPLFDQMKQTPMMAELQITQEYTGQSRHLVYLGPMWKEFFDELGVDASNTQLLKGVAGVANIGSDANWCGHHFSQANWYVFGRLAWNPALSTAEIARDWLRQTFSCEDEFDSTMTAVMEKSREACVDYMMPLGLHHIFKGDHHYGPEPEGNQPHFPDEWKPVWYHKADTAGIGFNRSTTGTGATLQYREPYCTVFDNPATCPEKYLLWFHHLPWDYTMANGNTLAQNLVKHYSDGEKAVEEMVDRWTSVGKKYVDRRRYDEVYERLLDQLENAREWQSHCLDYFQKVSGNKLDGWRKQE